MPSMQNNLVSIDAELEKDRFKGLEMREINETEKFASQVFYTRKAKSGYKRLYLIRKSTLP